VLLFIEDIGAKGKAKFSDDDDDDVCFGWSSGLNVEVVIR
jgi:hypothetical protein